MTFLTVLPSIVASWLLAAHFFRAGDPGGAAACAILPILLVSRRLWVLLLGRVLPLAGGAVWVLATLRFVTIRKARGEPFLRLVIILGVVAILTAVASLPFWISRRLRQRYTSHPESAAPCASAFVLAGLLLWWILRWAGPAAGVWSVMDGAARLLGAVAAARLCEILFRGAPIRSP